MSKLLVLTFFMLASCGESIEPIKVEGQPPKAFQANPIDAVGVAEGDQQVSPFGRPSH